MPLDFSLPTDIQTPVRAGQTLPKAGRQAASLQRTIPKAGRQSQATGKQRAEPSSNKGSRLHCCLLPLTEKWKEKRVSWLALACCTVSETGCNLGISGISTKDGSPWAESAALETSPLFSTLPVGVSLSDGQKQQSEASPGNQYLPLCKHPHRHADEHGASLGSPPFKAQRP